MKTILITSLFVTASAFAGGPDFSGLQALPVAITFSPTVGPLFTTSDSLNIHKDVLEAAQEDAVKFVAGNGKVTVSPALREAITLINEQAKALDIEQMNDIQATHMIIMINTTPPQL